MNGEIMAIPTLEHVIEAAQTAVKNYPGGVRAMAASMDMAPSSLGNTINPYGDRSTAKLGLEQAIYIMRKTGDHRALVLMAAELGYRLASTDVEPNHADVRDECLDDDDKLVKFHNLARDPEVPPQALSAYADTVHRDIDETLVAHRRWWEERMAARA